MGTQNGNVYSLIFGRCRCKMSGFIKLGVVWNVLFWHKSQNLSLINHSRNIIQPGIKKERKSHNDQHVMGPGRRTDLFQTLQTALQKDILQKEIITGIS